MKEIWKNIPEYKGVYQASNLGNIRSLDRVTNGRKIKGKVMKKKHRGPVPTITLSHHGRQTYRISALVVSAFKNIPLDDLYGVVIKHKDGDKENCAIKNLKLIK